MNLKESFRYQNFLESMLNSACSSIMTKDHCLKIIKVHLRNKVNPDAQDVAETADGDILFANDDVIAFIKWLVTEREKLTKAIGVAKDSIGFDIDAAIETNKFRQTANNSIKSMLRFSSSKRIDQGRDYKFNVEGNQMPYIYEIEVISEEAYDKDRAKAVMRALITEADKISADIDAALINTKVEYEPVFDVNETFEDVMTEFLENVLERNA